MNDPEPAVTPSNRYVLFYLEGRVDTTDGPLHAKHFKTYEELYPFLTAHRLHTLFVFDHDWNKLMECRHRPLAEVHGSDGAYLRADLYYSKVVW